MSATASTAYDAASVSRRVRRGGKQALHAGWLVDGGLRKTAAHHAPVLIFSSLTGTGSCHAS